MRLPLTKGRRSLTVVASMALVGLIALTASAAHTFQDVPDTHTFHDDIAWMRDSGITKGCNPPANTEFCPDDFASRGELAAFFRRFAEAGVVDADTLDGKDSTDFLGKNEKAADSDLLDGKDSSEFVQVGDGLGAALAASLYIATETEEWLLAVNNEVIASCDDGDVLISGGYQAEGLLEVNVEDSYPSGGDWVVRGTASVLADVTAYAICVRA
jgi:hypothetical protein